ncbi:MAG: metal ABC transporter permease [Treponema sp.]|nr:metal ABC transporter permease [Treponema sp.]MCL2252610.1 metal ABC transporter permease [Treponema sp.]
MQSFFEGLININFPFLRNALFAGILSSVLFGILGSVVTVRRIGSLAGAVSHAVLGGIGMALFLSATVIPGFPPIAGALIFALLSAIIIALVSLKAKQREDTVINAIWVIGMSLGLLFMAKTPGYADPSTWLFGNILLISNMDLILLAVLDIIVILLARRFYAQIEASSFDEEFARTRGVPVEKIFLLLLGLTAVAIVLLQTFVGIVMVIAMLTLPSGCSSVFSKSLSGMMLSSCLFAALFSVSGLISGWLFNLPIGAMTVIIAGGVFLIISAIKAKYGK